MLQAFKNVKRNRGAAGIDKISVQMFEAPINKIPDENLASLMRDLKTRGKFQPKPLRRVLIQRVARSALGFGNIDPSGFMLGFAPLTPTYPGST